MNNNLLHFVLSFFVDSRKFYYKIRNDNSFCIPITFNNPLKVYFSGKKYLITIQTHPTQIIISIFLIEKPVINRFLKIIGVQNQ